MNHQLRYFQIVDFKSDLGCRINLLIIINMLGIMRILQRGLMHLLIWLLCSPSTLYRGWIEKLNFFYIAYLFNILEWNLCYFQFREMFYKLKFSFLAITTILSSNADFFSMSIKLFIVRLLLKIYPSLASVCGGVRN